MDVLIVGLLLVLGYWLWNYLRRGEAYFQQMGIPYLPGWPLFGNMAGSTLLLKHHSEVVREIYNFNKEAKYVGAMDLFNPVIVLRDPELIKSVTIKNFDNFVDHYKLVDVSVDPLFGGMLFSMEGDKWREARNLLTPAFTSSKMRGMFDLMVQCARNLASHIGQKPDKDEGLECKDLFSRFTSDVIATCAFGLDVDSLKEPNNEFYMLGKTATNFEGLLSLKFLLARGMPSVLKFFRIKLFPDYVVRFFENLVSSTIAMREERGIRRPDMIQLMMDARSKTSENLKMDITEMTAQAFVFFLGGFDTSSRQMCIIAYELALNPDIQEKLQNEIDSVLGETNEPTYDTINAMPYLDAVFNESTRLHPQADTIDRVCTKEFELPPAVPGASPLKLKPGMTVWVPVAGIHYDPQYYEDPRSFKPERFLNKKLNPMDNLAFGIGPRNCIGNRFAILETKILIFYLLAKFNLKLRDERIKKFEYVRSNLAVVPKGGYSLKFISRKS